MPLTNRVLADLAAAFGISTEVWDWKGRLTAVDDATVVGILETHGAGLSVQSAQGRGSVFTVVIPGLDVASESARAAAAVAGHLGL